MVVSITQTGSGARSGGSPLTYSNRVFGTLLITLAMLCSFIVVPASAESIEDCHDSLRHPTVVTAVHVQPDDGPQPILDEIKFAACSIDISMYIFTNQDVFDGLEFAVDRGLRLRVILERQPFGSFGDQQDMYDRLTAAGIDVRWGPDQFTYSHSKYMIADSSVLVVTNQNFTNAGFNNNREFGVITTDPRYVKDAKAIFTADWNRSQVSDSIEYLVVSPINSRFTIVEMIAGSTESVWMYAEVLRDDDVTNALSAAAERGVDVRILVNPSADEDDAPYFLQALTDGVQVRVLRDPYVHSKALIVDGTSALVGSQNYSYTSLDLNREVGIVLTDTANLDRIVSVYVRDWSHGEPVDTISRDGSHGTAPQSALTQPSAIGRISSVRWRVV